MGCKNYPILQENQRKMCLCTGMVYDKLDDQYSQRVQETIDILETQS
jgi:hypothetical protein